MLKIARLPTLILCSLLCLTACKNQRQQAPSGSSTQSGSACSNDVLGGSPETSVSQTETLCHDRFVVLFNPQTADPVYSAEHLTIEQSRGTQARAEGFSPDPLLPANQQVDTRSYTHSGYDRGHLSPAADFKGENENIMAQSFYTSNIAPQNPELNREAWQGIENITRACARQENGIYVITGVIASPQGERLSGQGASPVIPSAYWKVAYNDHDYRAVLMPNVATPKMPSYRQFYVTLSDIERQSGVKVAPQLSLHRQSPGALCTGSF